MRNEAENAGQGGRLRVILGASCYPDAEAALALALDLARQTGAELHGVFVRETALLAAGYAYSRVVTYSGQRQTGLTAGALAKAFQADARRFEGLLARRAKAAALVSSFSEAEGHLQEELRRCAAAGDILISGFKPILPAAGCIAVILAEGQAVPGFALRLARSARKPLVALVACAAAAQTGPAAAPAAAPAGPPGDVAETRLCAQPEVLLRQLEHMSPVAVIVAAPLAGLPPPARIQEAARCPLVLRSGG
ncbi:hypothetical protein [Leisingera aquaemixtae]|uniref:Universal stress protein family protein n=1 Tax=Leisingera aquaemixtae TaxID=1396826 RepID=A0A0P1H5P6_9RHOB|nr:hypothetical protein [Leisingera aquaemixtae]CUH98278.1 hypothetical protein PHA8399_00392 [Leisingera aquaemixtae]